MPPYSRSTPARPPRARRRAARRLRRRRARRAARRLCRRLWVRRALLCGGDGVAGSPQP